MDRYILVLAFENASNRVGLVRLVCFVHVRAVSPGLSSLIQDLMCLMLVK